MSSENSLSKRIKRHVIGRRRTYFAATSPGFEAICHQELSALGLSIENASVVEGGVEFDGRLQDCYQANLHLRTAGRILLRIDQFKATGFRQLEKKVAEIPWELYLPPNVLPDIHVTTKHCRLYHTAAVGQRFLDGISRQPVSSDFGGGKKKRDLIRPYYICPGPGRSLYGVHRQQRGPSSQARLETPSWQGAHP